MVSVADLMSRWRARGKPSAQAGDAEPPECRDCGDTGWRVDPGGIYDVAERCNCRKGADAAARWRAVVPPARSDRMTLASYVPRTPEQRKALALARSFLKRAGRGDMKRGIALLGDVGSGKTHLLVAISRELVDAGVSLSFVDFDRLAGDVRRCYSSDRDAVSLLREALDATVVVMDELGKGRGTEWECWLADQVITTIYQAGGVVLVGSNHPAKADGGKFCPLQERIGDRAFSRLQEMAAMLSIKGRDGRKYDDNA